MRKLWKIKLVRLPVKTFAQTLAGVLAGSGAGLIDADWVGALSVAGMAGVLSFLMNVGGDDPQDRPQPVDYDRVEAVVNHRDDPLPFQED